MLAGFNLKWVFFFNVAQCGPFWVTVFGVVVEADLGIQGNEVALWCCNQRIDLHHGAVHLLIGLVKLRDEADKTLEGSTAKSKSES